MKATNISSLVLLTLISVAHSHLARNASTAIITAQWNKVIAISNTTATLQVVAAPILNPKVSPVATKLFETLRHLQADLVRYVPWFPYPHYGVAELDPPNATTKKSLGPCWA